MDGSEKLAIAAGGVAFLALLALLVPCWLLRRQRIAFNKERDEDDRLRTFGWNRKKFDRKMRERDIVLVRVGYLRALYVNGETLPPRDEM